MIKASLHLPWEQLLIILHLAQQGAQTNETGRPDTNCVSPVRTVVVPPTLRRRRLHDHIAHELT
jgi:hypothetical protein